MTENTPTGPVIHREPMSGMPDDIERMKQELRATVRGDDQWRHPDLYDENEPVNMVAPTPPIYKAAHAFLSAVFGEEGYTPDSVGQLVEFVNCLRIMNDREGHPWSPDGELWRKAGLLNLTGDVYKKHERFQYRLWTLGIIHPDSGWDLVNFILFCLRSDPNSRFGARGEPAPPREDML